MDAASSDESPGVRAATARSLDEADVETTTDLGKKGGASTLNGCFEREELEVEVDVEVGASAVVADEVVVVVVVAVVLVVVAEEMVDGTGGGGGGHSEVDGTEELEVGRAADLCEGTACGEEL